jgi:hypothetical protein
MAKSVATLLGFAFVLVGIVGFVDADLLGFHLSTFHNVIHLVSGAVALWVGSRGTVRAARSFCLVFGLLYLGLGAAGFVAGDGGDKILTIVPGDLVLGARDHLLHVVLGAVFLLAGIATRTAPRTTATTYTRA